MITERIKEMLDNHSGSSDIKNIGNYSRGFEAGCNTDPDMVVKTLQHLADDEELDADYRAGLIDGIIEVVRSYLLEFDQIVAA